MDIRPVLPESYNQFAGPIQADRLLWSDHDQTTAVMRAIGNLVLEAGMQDVLCLRLLHRHHHIEPNTMMLEFEGQSAGSRALITAMTAHDDASDYLPNVLSVTEFGLGGAEYARLSVFSDPARVAEVLRDGKVLAAIRDRIIEADLQSVLAIGFRNKPFFDAGDADAMMIEVTDEASGQSIITWEPGDDVNTVIQTLWGFEARLASATGGGKDEPAQPTDEVGSGTPEISCDVRCFVGCRETDGVHHETGHEADHIGLPETKRESNQGNNDPASGTPTLPE